MKHLLTAALIATAIASPLSAREVVLNCERIGADDDALDFMLRVNTETLSAAYIGINFDEPMHTMISNDEYVIWARGVNLGPAGIVGWMLHLDRQSLRLQHSYSAAHHFIWAEALGDSGAGSTPYQCNYGI